MGDECDSQLSAFSLQASSFIALANSELCPYVELQGMRRHVVELLHELDRNEPPLVASWVEAKISVGGNSKDKEKWEEDGYIFVVVQGNPWTGELYCPSRVIMRTTEVHL